MKKNIYINRDKSNIPLTLDQLKKQGLLSEIGDVGDIGDVGEIGEIGDVGEIGDAGERYEEIHKDNF